MRLVDQLQQVIGHIVLQKSVFLEQKLNMTLFRCKIGFLFLSKRKSVLYVVLKKLGAKLIKFYKIVTNSCNLKSV